MNPNTKSNVKKREMHIILKTHDAKVLYGTVIHSIKKKLQEMQNGVLLKIIPKPNKTRMFTYPKSPHVYAKTNKVSYTLVTASCTLVLKGPLKDIHKATSGIKIPSCVNVTIKMPKS